MTEVPLLPTINAFLNATSALLLVWENIWARTVAQAVRDADGELLDFGRIPHDVVQIAREWALSNAGGEA